MVHTSSTNFNFISTLITALDVFRLSELLSFIVLLIFLRMLRSEVSTPVLRGHCPTKRPRDIYESLPIKRQNRKKNLYPGFCTPTKDSISIEHPSCKRPNIFTSVKMTLCQITLLSSPSKKRNCSAASRNYP